MEWLTLLVSHPLALASFLTWLKLQEQHCAEFALDVGDDERKALKGKRDSFRDLTAYVQNNLGQVKRGLLPADASTSGLSHNQGV